jgi:hypothetical protein
MKNLLNRICTKELALNALFVLFLIAIGRNFIKTLFVKYDLGTYFISEFLVNYQGGFVRRGLLGEIMFFFRNYFTFDVEWTVKIFCTICFLLVCFFFIYQFAKRNFSLYILPLCFFCGALVINNEYWIRKDSLMILFLIASLWIFQTPKKIPVALKIAIINILLIFMTLCHEVFAFISLPIFLVMFIHLFIDKGFLKSLGRSLLFLCPTIIIFLLVMSAKGNYQTAQTIWDSWHILLNLELSPVAYNNSLGALYWQTIPTMKSHFSEVFLTIEWGVLSFFVWCIILPVIYYISTNFLLVFHKEKSNFNEDKKTILSALIIFQFVFLLPLFLGLSKDYIRLAFYLITSSFAIFLLIPFDTLKQLFPIFYIRCIEKLNQKLHSLIPPSKPVLVILMLTIGIANWGFNIYDTITNTMLYQVLKILTIAVKPLVEIAHQILS